MTDRARQLAEHLEGTCKSLDEGCEALFGHDASEMTMDELQRLDGLVFECSHCGWWFEFSEESYDEPGACESCSPSEQD